MKSNRLLQIFQEYLIVVKRLSDNSVYSYRYDLNKFKSFLDDRQIDILKVQAEDISKFISSEKKRKVSDRTIAREVVAVRQFYKFLKKENKLKDNPTEKIETPDIGREIPDFLTIDEVNQFFSSLDEEKVFELRDKCIFEILYSSGLRISEACNLRVEDIDRKEFIIIVSGKGDKQRLVPFGEKTLDILNKYLSISRPRILKGKDSNYLFVSNKGGGINRKSVWRLLNVYIARTNINKKVTPHTLRHSFATHLIENQADLKSVQQLLGHIDISTTQIYTHLAKNKLRDIHKKYHPRG